MSNWGRVIVLCMMLGLAGMVVTPLISKPLDSLDPADAPAEPSPMQSPPPAAPDPKPKPAMLLQSLKDKDPKVRVSAAAELARVGGHHDTAIPVLLGSLTEENDEVRDIAQMALQELGRYALPALTASVVEAKAKPAELAATCRILAETGMATDKNMPAIFALRNSPDARLSAWATIAAAKLDPKQCQEAQIVPLLKSQHADVREEALAVLEEMGYEKPVTDEASIALLISMFSDDEEDVRTRVVGVLCNCRLTEAHVPALTKALANEKSRGECLNLFTYPVVVPQGIVPALIDALGAEGSTLRGEASEALARIGTPAVAPLLALAGNDGAKPDARRVAIRTLGLASELPPDVEKLLWEMVLGRDRALRAEAAVALGLHGVSDSKVLQALAEAVGLEGDDDAPVVNALEKLGHKALPAIRLIAPSLKSESFGARRMAATALMKINPDDDIVIGSLAGCLASHAEDGGWLRDELYKCGPKAVGPLIKVLDSNDDRAVCDAAVALGYFRSSAASAVPKLKQLLTKQKDVARAAAEAIVHIDPQVVGPVPVLVAALDAGEGRYRTPSPISQQELERGAKEEEVPYVSLFGTTDICETTRVLVRAGAAAKAATPVLIRRLKESDNFDTWAEAAGLLGPLAAETAPILLENLKDRQRFDAAGKALANVGPAGEAALPVLMAMLSDPAMGVTAAEHLGRFGKRAAPAVPALAVLLKCGDDQLAAAAASALGEIGPPALIATTQLVIAVETGPRHTPMAAAAALAKLKAPTALPRLITLLESPDDDRCDAASLALKGYGAAANGAVPQLIKNLKVPGRRHGAIHALGGIGSAATPAVRPIAQYLSDPAVPAFSYAVTALADLGPDAVEALPELEKLLKLPDRSAVEEVTNAIWKIDAVRARSLGLKKPVPAAK